MRTISVIFFIYLILYKSKTKSKIRMKQTTWAIQEFMLVWCFLLLCAFVVLHHKKYMFASSTDWGEGKSISIPCQSKDNDLGSQMELSTDGDFLWTSPVPRSSTATWGGEAWTSSLSAPMTTRGIGAGVAPTALGSWPKKVFTVWMMVPVSGSLCILGLVDWSYKGQFLAWIYLEEESLWHWTYAS